MPGAAATVSFTAVPGIPLIEKGDDLADIIAHALRDAGMAPATGDVLVIAQKIVSKAEGRMVALDDVTPSARAIELAAMVRKDARLVELILSESTEVLRAKADVLIVVHRLGYVMANAGIDQSNVSQENSAAHGSDRALLLPIDPDTSCATLKNRLDREFSCDVGVIINDSFGRAWRKGVVGVALGCAGFGALRDMVGKPDLYGRAMRVTQIGVADEVAAGASLVMGQADEGRPVVLVRGLAHDSAATPAAALLRAKHEDLFR
jgi:coenzyme F420-0:L-glutamate ligase/coenzyme F420-1:gamma-L-glutamate ligase